MSGQGGHVQVGAILEREGRYAVVVPDGLTAEQGRALALEGRYAVPVVLTALPGTAGSITRRTGLPPLAVRFALVFGARRGVLRLTPRGRWVAVPSTDQEEAP